MILNFLKIRSKIGGEQLTKGPVSIISLPAENTTNVGGSLIFIVFIKIKK